MTILLTDRTTKYAIQNHIRAHCLDVCPAGRLAEPVRQHLCAQLDTGGHAGIFTVTSKQPQRHRVPQDTAGKSGGRERTADSWRICGQEVRRAIPGISERLYSRLQEECRWLYAHSRHFFRGPDVTERVMTRRPEKKWPILLKNVWWKFGQLKKESYLWRNKMRPVAVVIYFSEYSEYCEKL